ncbi:MFS family permease OS=Streptomyces albaduncus OX=68172 GN=FHS32_003786 PE=4 SV=1 [Streptomyces griseoloalbus]
MASTVTTSKDSAAPSRPGYGRLLRTRGAWTFLLPGFAARQPFAMLTLSIVLLVQHTTGSYGAAGAVAAVTGVSMALFAPYTGRLADRHGQRAVLVPGVLVHAGGRARPDRPGAERRLPLGAVRRRRPHRRLRTAGRADGPRRGVRLKGSPLMATAAAFESVTDEFTFVVGPLLATALCTTVDPSAGLVTEAALTLVGGLLFAAQKGTQPPVATAADGPHADGTPPHCACPACAC